MVVRSHACPEGEKRREAPCHPPAIGLRWRKTSSCWPDPLDQAIHLEVLLTLSETVISDDHLAELGGSGVGLADRASRPGAELVLDGRES